MNSNLTHMLQQIVSGGQTGVDQGALEAAIWLGIPHGGWCPKGRRSESGPIPPRFLLQETEARDYAVRTEKNVVDSDATLILYRNQLSGGTAFTFKMAGKHRRPCLTVDLASEFDPTTVHEWLVKHEIEVLNIAGPRESSQAGIAEEARLFMVELLR